MIYSLSLSFVATVLGILYVIGHFPGIFWPKEYTDFLKKLPRHYPLGIVLAGLAGLWFCWLTATTDLGELSSHRWILVMLWFAATLLHILLVPTFLAVRGLAMLMLLAVGTMLDAAFFFESPLRLVVTILAYLWATIGILLMASPYWLRDAIDWACHTTKRLQILSSLGTVGGLLLWSLGWFVYPYIV